MLKLSSFKVPYLALLILSTSATARADIWWATGNNGSALIQFDTVSAATTVIGNFTTGGTYGLAFAPDNTAYTLQGSNATLAKVNLSTAALTTVGGPGGFFGYALDFAPTGILYAINVNTNVVYTVNTTTGNFTSAGTVSGASAIMDIAFTSAGDLYAVQSDNSIYKINPLTWTASVAYSTALGNLMGLAADNQGHLLATAYASPSQFETINLSTGTSSITGTIGAGTSYDHGGDIILTPAAVPEPGSMLLVSSALLIAGLTRKRLRSRKAQSSS